MRAATAVTVSIYRLENPLASGPVGERVQSGA